MIITYSILASDDVIKSNKIEILSIAPLIGEAIERISKSSLRSMVITDTIEPTKFVAQCPKIRIITAAPLLAHAMLNISNESSVSSLFSEESLKPIYEGLYSN